MVVIMKKIMTLVLTSIVCSQLIYGAADERTTLKAQIKALGGSLQGLGTAGIPLLRERLAALQAAQAAHGDDTLPVRVPVHHAPFTSHVMDRDVAAAGHREAEAREEGGIVAWAKWLIGGCFGCCEATAGCVREYPVCATAACALCCAGCGMHLGATAAYMTPGAPVAKMYVTASKCCYVTSVLGACCCIRPCVGKVKECLVRASDMNANFAWCAECFAKGAAKAKASISGEDKDA